MGQKHSAAAAAAPQQAEPVADGPLVLQAFKHPIMLQGLDGAGKRSVQQRMQIPEERTLRVDDKFLTSPAIYSNDRSSTNYPHWGDKRDNQVWASGGRMGARAIWSMIAYNTKALVFVVDASDRASLQPGPDAPAPLPESFVKNFFMKQAPKQAEILATLKARMTAKQVFASLLATGRLENRPILVLANKQDVAGAMGPVELAEVLGLPALTDRDWRISGCNAQTGEGLQEAFAWLNFVISAPTDFTKIQEAKQAIMSQKWNEKYKLDEAARRAARVVETTRDRKIGAGMVLAAPLPLPTRKDGSTWTASAEQLETFVLPEAAQDTEQELAAIREATETKAAADAFEKTMNEPAVVDAAAAVAPVVEAKVVEKETVVVEPVSVKAVESVKVAWAAESDSAEHSATEVSSKARTESSVHSAAGGELDGDVHNNETLGVQLLVNEAPDRNPDAVVPFAAAKEEESKPVLLEAKVMPSPAGAFTSLSSSFVVLPPLSAIPTLEMRLAKKHWYSKKHLRPVPAVEDIHGRFRHRQNMVDDPYRTPWGF